MQIEPEIACTIRKERDLEIVNIYNRLRDNLARAQKRGIYKGGMMLC